LLEQVLGRLASSVPEDMVVVQSLYQHSKSSSFMCSISTGRAVSSHPPCCSQVMKEKFSEVSSLQMAAR